MELNEWTQQLRSLYDQALRKYKAGERGAGAFFDDGQTAFLASIGLKPINLYDYVEDYSKNDEPDWNTALLMMSARRDYFLYEQREQSSTKLVEQGDLPPKLDALDGIEWLPRILVKAQAYLEGSLCEEIMYCCGGDRNFLKAHQLHPADFLRMVWSARGDESKVLEFVRRAA